MTTTTTITTGKIRVKSGLSTGSVTRFSRGARWSPSLTSGLFLSLSGGFYVHAEHDVFYCLGNVRRSRAHTFPRRPSSRYGRRSSRASLWDPRAHTCARLSARTSSRVCLLSAHALATTMTTMARGRHTSSVSPRGARGSSNGVLRTRSTRTFPHAARTSSFS